MATAAIIIGGAITNAIAFTTGNALYDKFCRNADRKKELGTIKRLES